MTDVQVHVALGGKDALAGTLYSHRRHGTESATFAYDGGYFSVPGAYALDPELPLTAGAQQTPVGRALFGAFTDCAPDRWGRTLAPGAKYLSTAIGFDDDPASLAAALEVADYYRLSDPEARTILRDVATAVSRWREVAGQHQLTPSEIAEMEPAFAALAEAGDR